MREQPNATWKSFQKNIWSYYRCSFVDKTQTRYAWFLQSSSTETVPFFLFFGTFKRLQEVFWPWGPLKITTNSCANTPSARWSNFQLCWKQPGDCFGFALLRSVIGPENSRKSNNQCNHSRLLRPRFPVLYAVCLFLLWVVIGSSKHFPFFLLAIFISLVLVPWHLSK